ncbi:uncharacterized protein LOC125204881 [Salvia hispanica]|uniref:uncharacterized protein LOC125204881 n=1 Tax=Salvia hispanica TaxID=49212 RepID=UPI002009A56B|nr:uncharacterized protein LOC125204881 [Salvia hispanica]XP_047959598.1 uncharacterized protein LOC125204881 [Salvia hispanica]
MRIRKRLALCDSIPTQPLSLSDLHLPRSQPPCDLKTEEKMKQKEFGDDDRMNTSNNDIRKIVSIVCHGEEDSNTNMQPSSSSLQGRCCVESYKLVPLKKRIGIFERNPSEEGAAAKMKSKMNKKYGDARKEKGKKSKRGNVIMEGSRCSRVNGRGWRCCQATLVGYSLCEHHLGKGRLRSTVGVVKARSISSLLRQI